MFCSVLYLVQRLAITKDKVDGALDVAVFEVVTPSFIIQGVLCPIERAVVERCHVSLDQKRHCLPSYCSPNWCWCRILQHTKQSSPSPVCFPFPLELQLQMGSATSTIAVGKLCTGVMEVMY